MTFATDADRKISIPRAIRANCSVYIGATMYRMDWTDDRLQERFDSIDRRFDEVDRRFEQVDMRFEQVDKRFEQVDKRFDKVDTELSRINSRIDGLQRTIMQTNVAIFAALLGLIATQL
jgi:septal ring factor EnvC (AmiA/AmiB activator)